MKNKSNNIEYYNILIWQIVVSLITAVILSIYAKSILGGIIICALILIPYPIIAYFFKKYKKLSELKKSGIIGYCEKFDSKTDCDIFNKESLVKETFCYFGASTNTILELLKEWTAYNPTISVFKFLLINPESKELKKQIAFERNIPESMVADEVIETEIIRIESAIKVLKDLRPYKESKMEIRLYSNFVPCWFYLIDERTIYLGIMEKGKRSNQSVIITEKLNDNSTLFDVYKNTWDCIWSDATPVN